ncbi:MAG: hypothetical protein WAU41_16410 [Gaiellaceae bacterium]
MSSLRRIECQVLLIGLASVMVADLFLDWRSESTLDAFGIAGSPGQSTGLAGWGSVAVALLVALLIIEAVDLAIVRWSTRLVDVEALLAVGVLVATTGAFVGCAVGVSSRGVVEVTLNRADMWPAYVGVALAVLVAFVALGRSLIEARVGTSQRRVGPAPSTSSPRRRGDRLPHGVGGHVAS